MAKRRTKDGGSAVVKADGALCLTFVNTGTKRRRSIGDYGELLDWGLRHRSLASAGAERLAGLAGERPEDAAAAFATAEDLRGVVSAVMNARADRTKPPPEAIDELNSRFVLRLPPRRLTPAESGFRWAWAGAEDDLLLPLWPVVWSAAAILTSKDYGRIGRCAGEDCGILFVVRNSGTPRRWCDMKVCGNRVKSKRHYHRRVKPERLDRVRRLRERWGAGAGSLSPLERAEDWVDGD